MAADTEEDMEITFTFQRYVDVKKVENYNIWYVHLKSYVTYINYMSKDSYVCRSERLKSQRIEYFEFSSAYLFNKFRATNPYIYKSHDFTSAPGYKIDCWFYSESLEWVERQGGNLTFSYSNQHLVDPHSTAIKSTQNGGYS